MLFPAAILGLVVFIYGIVTMWWENQVSDEICNDYFNLTMCPLCDKFCGYWSLGESCQSAMASHLFDNPATVFFAIFMSLWSTMFLELWKRRRHALQYLWDLQTFRQEEERPRPQFEAQVRHTKRNWITQEDEPWLPFIYRIPRYMLSAVLVLFAIALAVGAVFGVIMYRVSVQASLALNRNELIATNANLVTTATAATINLTIILLLNMIYSHIAEYLTELEQPRTETEFDDSFTFKMFLLQFVNYYSAIFYIAFFKGRLIGRPGKYVYTLGYRQEECSPSGCLVELCMQLGITMAGSQLVANNLREIFLPKILVWLNFRWLIQAMAGKSEEERKKTGLSTMGTGLSPCGHRPQGTVLRPEISKVQDDEVGDGTTSVTVLACELLKEAEKLVAQKIHPQTIVAGYRRATDVARAALQDASIDHGNEPEKFREDLMNIARTTLGSKILTQYKEHFSKLSVDAVLRLKGSTSLDAIKIIKIPGGGLVDSYLDEGFLLQKKPGVNQPKRVENARILIGNTSMDADKIKVFGSRVRVDSVAKVAELELAEKEKMKEKVGRILKHNINVFINRQVD
ncbi:anoctamin-1-like [Branchiostoma floridae]|uniref:Anoctamin n=1 Tax=Branchiostoma floridae TaxID=7739 RepID=A0A9J7HQC2_BRAFL|nr:anoctamin-1-like [Branchiostoma floridae]